jgi:hypothetical protein
MNLIAGMALDSQLPIMEKGVLGQPPPQLPSAVGPLIFLIRVAALRDLAAHARDDSMLHTSARPFVCSKHRRISHAPAVCKRNCNNACAAWLRLGFPSAGEVFEPGSCEV